MASSEGNNQIWGRTFSSNRAVFAKDDTTVLLSTEDVCGLFEDGVAGFGTGALRVHAENVAMRAPVDLSGGAAVQDGKALLVQCHELAILATPGEDKKVDVSGGNGESGFDRPTGAGTPGGPGCAGGTLLLCVETPRSLQQLLDAKFYAKGGAGGDGGAASEASGKSQGGAGGDGGSGGRCP